MTTTSTDNMKTEDNKIVHSSEVVIRCCASADDNEQRIISLTFNSKIIMRENENAKRKVKFFGLFLPQTEQSYIRQDQQKNRQFVFLWKRMRYFFLHLIIFTTFRSNSYSTLHFCSLHFHDDDDEKTTNDRWNLRWYDRMKVKIIIRRQMSEMRSTIRSSFIKSSRVKS